MNSKKKEITRGSVVVISPLTVLICRGNARDALLLSQLIYWGTKSLDEGKDGWFFDSATDFYWQTGLSRRQIDLGVNDLVSLGFIEYKTGEARNRRHFRIIPANIVREMEIQYNQMVRSVAPNSATKWAELHQMVQAVAPNSATLITLLNNPSFTNPPANPPANPSPTEEVEEQETDEEVNNNENEAIPVAPVPASQEVPVARIAIQDVPVEKVSETEEEQIEEDEIPELKKDPETIKLPAGLSTSPEYPTPSSAPPLPTPDDEDEDKPKKVDSLTGGGFSVEQQRPPSIEQFQHIKGKENMEAFNTATALWYEAHPDVKPWSPAKEEAPETIWLELEQIGARLRIAT
jgi:hypothetical protein